MRRRSRSTNGRAARSSSIARRFARRWDFVSASVADAEALAEWLVTNVTQSERSGERVREQLMARCRDERIEPPTSGRVDRIIRSALSRGEDVLFAQVSGPQALRSRSASCSN
jgi:hypothetical protein